jgi:hypothetical protein
LITPALPVVKSKKTLLNKDNTGEIQPTRVFAHIRSDWPTTLWERSSAVATKTTAGNVFLSMRFQL